MTIELSILDLIPIYTLIASVTFFIAFGIGMTILYKINDTNPYYNFPFKDVFLVAVPPAVTIAILTILFIPLPTSLMSNNFDSFKNEVKESYGMHYVDEDNYVENGELQDFIDSDGNEKSCTIEEVSEPSGTITLASSIFGDKTVTNEFKFVCADDASKIN